MPFCPTCRSEYIPGIERCADCGDALVDQLPEEDPGEEFQLVKLHSFPGEVYANMVGEALEHEGIPYLVQKEVLGSTTIVQGATEGTEVTLYVNQEDFEDADAILNQMVDHI
jgi:hypothetical protein